MEKDNGKAKAQDSKGKSVATKQDDYTNSVGSRSNTSSIISRIGASTSKLANDMILRHPSNASAADVLPSSKAESSRASPGISANETSKYRSGPSQASSSGTFKSTAISSQHNPNDLDFSAFLDDTGVLEEAEHGNINGNGHEEIHSLKFGPTARSMTIMATDGMAVVDLLDSRYDEVEHSVMSLTDIEQDTLRYRLFSDIETREYPSRRGEWEDVLNFFPDSGLNGSDVREYVSLLGVSDVEEAKRIWIGQWQRVLSSYTDDVWGELGSLVNVAKEELSDLSKSDEDVSPSKAKALRRLQQILVHIR
ncbi:uncharacterized protein F4822DRAFT_431914 [Hypoxylon trugodes]|uniref:uncharacterized protein n=1 Tax=Hypoxylon trugodes TaxID=326681 RepID=UPI0021A00F5B|nr:uncharacterized protein F4822DRAFT_431914 [Hypoxylon trugodes]KAI1387047.1 hypothetical protein F4822DRAFT_431914 [Hypoxylon trugodes]